MSQHPHSQDHGAPAPGNDGSQSAPSITSITSDPAVPDSSITITSHTPAAHSSQQEGATRLPVVRHVAVILDEYRAVLKHRARLHLQALDLARTLDALPSTHPRRAAIQARLDLLTAGIGQDTDTLTLLTLELRYASTF